MARPPFSLTDDQARILAARIPELVSAHPLEQDAARPVNHRPFTRAFILAVLEATGNIYSPAIYRRLLTAYCPDRKPSNDTLSAEINQLRTTFPRKAFSGPELPQHDAVTLATLVRSMSQSMPTPQHIPANDQGLREIVDYLKDRLTQAESELNNVRATAARSATEQRSAYAARDEAIAAREEAMRLLHSQAAQYEKQIAGLRNFSMTAIEAARGETREVKAQCEKLQARLNRQAIVLESFRQVVYRSGAAVPKEAIDAMEAGEL